MAKEDVLEILEAEFCDPGGYKSGEYLWEHVLRRSAKIVQNDRPGLVEVLQEWIGSQTEPRTMLAVWVAQSLGIRELIPQIQRLREQISSGKLFYGDYLKDIDEALSVLEEQGQTK